MSEQKPIGNTFTKGMVKDLSDSAMGAEQYFNAINATTVLPDGGIGTGLSTEAANRLSIQKSPYKLIGVIYTESGQYCTFWTDNIHSEIGIYTEATDSYQLLINDAATIAASLPGMNFNTTSLITGGARRGYDCGFDVYWSDGRRNPDRCLNTATCPFATADPLLQPNPWFQNQVVVSPGCVNFVNTNRVDIRQLLLAPSFNIPCLQLTKGQAGILENGSYQVAMCYTVNGFKATDYVALSNIQSIWTHIGQGGSVILTLSNLETVTFKEMEIVIISFNNQNVQARRIGLYSTTETTIYIDNISNQLIQVPLSDIPISSPAIVSSDMIAAVPPYLLRSGITERPDINYQPLANQIGVHWVCIEYPGDYYAKGGTNVGSLRGESYAYFLRWVYNTGDKTASYPLIGPASPNGTFNNGGPSVAGGLTIAHGDFESYVSTEIYPNDRPSVWNSNVGGHPEWNVCGQPIRWFKYPDQSSGFGGTIPTASGMPILSHYWNYGTNTDPISTIRVMGLYLDNIQAPVDLAGNIIPDIQGYEVLRATRDGNMTIQAKGMINNMRTYSDNAGQKGLFQNYPYNDLSPDKYITSNVANLNNGPSGGGDGENDPLTGYRNDVLSFHSPETVFEQPFLGTGVLKLTMSMQGNSHGQFEVPYKHPLFKVLTNFDGDIASVVSFISGAASILNSLVGGYDVKLGSTEDLPMSFPLGVNANYAEGPFGGLATIEYVAATVFNVALAIVMLPIQFNVIRQQLLNVIKGLIPGRQYAAQYNSSGFYATPHVTGASTSPITDYGYILGQMQFFAGLTINNLYRNNFVALQLNGGISPLTGDNSRYILSDIGNSFDWDFSHNIESYYASYITPLAAQYGQVDSAKQVPISCMYPIIPSLGARYTSPVLFGGDTYITRYTEKNPMLFFNDWLVDVPEDYVYNYRNYVNVPYPMFWIDNTNVYHDFLTSVADNRRLNGPVNAASFYVKSGYFYLFCNGVRDFYVESSINVGYRDYGESIQEQFYNPYGFVDINQWFRSDIIKTPSFYKYDFTLSANKFWNQWLSWSQCLRRDFDPALAYSCFAYYPRRVAYSLPQSEELKVDNWRIFLPNNYKDFNSNVTSIRSASKTGAIFLLDDDGPSLLPGVESISSSSGTQYNTGTGALFGQTLQTVVNIDPSIQYGSCQGKYCSVSTPFGIFWVSQRAGKIFHYTLDQQLVDVAQYGMRYWLALFLPSNILAEYPDFPLIDNPLVGVGVQLMYDNTNELLYITKKDYVASNANYVNGIWYAGKCPPGTSFVLGGICEVCSCGIACCPGTVVTFGDPNYFEDASWTLSYSPREKKFISFHDWHPALSISGEKHVITSSPAATSLWKHNEVSTSWCNYYGQQHSWEVELPINTGNNVVTIENIEYLLDSYNYRVNEIDKFNLYYDTINEAQIFNEEQSTLPMLLTPVPWNDPYARLNYPFTTGGGRNVICNKVENKWRFSQIRDFTDNRFQFGLGMIQMKNTSVNGYRWNWVTPYFNFFKDTFQLKKVRHRNNRVLLRKSDITTNSITLLAVYTNIVNSLR